MASGVYYNQEVTAEMLNGMAADLGHTSFNGFGDEKFGANELNKITGDLVSAGVLISGNMCRVVKDDSGNIILQTGIIVFGNGAKMDITSPITIDADAGTVIYALNDTLQGKCSIEVAESYPAEGDFVKLCSVNAGGTLADNRTVAKAKMELYTGNSSWSVTTSYRKDGRDWTETDIEIPRIVWEKYTYMLCFAEITTPNYKYKGLHVKDDIGAGTYLVYNDDSTCLRIKKFTRDDEKIKLTCILYDDETNYGENGKSTIILI